MNTQDSKVQIVEYIWTDVNSKLRSKARVINNEYNTAHILSPSTLPDWNYDGSSTGQAEGRDSEVIIVPRRTAPCPFRRGNNILVLCDEYDANGSPISSNYRVAAAEIFSQKPELAPWYGIEQEFFMRDARTGQILGFDQESASNPKSQGQYYCSVGAANAFGRKVIEAVLDNFLYAGLKVSGINAEVAPGQWEYQIGPVEGIDAADQMLLSRYILERTAEMYGVTIEYHPKPMTGDWNGSGCHTNFSTAPMRADGGLAEIEAAIERLAAKHAEHMAVYGEFNQLRMTGAHETASFEKFSYGRANRGASVRIGNQTYNDGKGYFEDRRPASNMNPYRVTSMLYKTCCLSD